MLEICLTYQLPQLLLISTIIRKVRVDYGRLSGIFTRLMRDKGFVNISGRIFTENLLKQAFLILIPLILPAKSEMLTALKFQTSV